VLRSFAAVLGLSSALSLVSPPASTVPALAQVTTTTVPAPWQPVPSTSPSGLASNGLLGVSCPAGGTCTAVGHAALPAGAPALIETLGPNGWQPSSAPAAPGTASNELSSISCSAPGSCVAVGWSTDVGGAPGTLVETLSGGNWAIAHSPDEGSGANFLTGVFCMSAASCVAVGYYALGTGYRALALVLSHGAWQLSAPLDQGPGDNYLEGIFCPAGGLCFAVGYYRDSAGHDRSLVERWSAGAWSLQPAGDLGASDNELYGIGCLSPTSCVAAGSYFNGHAYQALIEAFSTAGWAPSTSVVDASVANNRLNSVACASSGGCVAAGWYSNGQAREPLIERVSAGAWRPVKVPEEGAGDNALSGISCSSSSKCAAVGTYASGSEETALGLSLRDGVWQTVLAPAPSAPEDRLNSVSCPAAGGCTAVGSSVDGSGTPQALVEDLVNGSWSLEPAPGPAGGRLDGVSCSTPSSCVAVGWAEAPLTASGPQAFAEALSGGTWSPAVLPSPPGAKADALSAVSCPTVGNCVAVGWYTNGHGTQPLAETLSAGTWQLASVPSPDQAQLSAVSCATVGNCVAVGWYTNGHGTQPLAETLSAGTWQPASLPGAGELLGVSCPTAGNCAAVGVAYNGNVSETMVEMLANGGWALVPSPDPGPAADALHGVSCVSASSCVAVGDQEGSGAPEVLVEVLSDNSWEVAPSYNGASPGAEVLNGVSCTAATSACAAVGWSMDGEASLSLAESGQAPASLPVATTTTLSSHPDPSLVGEKVTYTAVVKPDPGGGTVAFIQDGALLRRCRAVPVRAGGTARCLVGYGAAGGHVLQASFSGTAGFLASVSLPYSQSVRHPPPVPQGYWLATRDGHVFAAGAAPALGGLAASGSGPVVGMAATPGGRGYWLVTSRGAVAAFGDARFFGDLPALHVKVGDIVAMAAGPGGRGYWLVGRDGGFFAFGDARFYGSLPARHVHARDIVGMAAVPGGRGYLLVGQDGGVFNFGKAHFYGSLPQDKVHAGDVRAILTSPGGRGYLLVGQDGGVFTFGRGARFYGSLPSRHLRVKDVVAAALTPDGKGYLMAGANGAVYGFGDAKLGVAPAGLAPHLPVVAVAEV
jgi:hypothetical protein